jgi:hypothetical protein
MPTSDELDDVVEKTSQNSEKERLSPEQYQDLKDAVFGEQFSELVLSDASYFVLGSYGSDEKKRLLLVRDELRERAGSYAFLMSEMPDAWEYWTTKFAIFADRADYVVGVFEHNRGGHEWEAGHLDHPEYRSKTHVLKRQYDTEEREREQFDAMFAHYLTKLDEQLGRVYRWSTEDELLARLEDVPR